MYSNIAWKLSNGKETLGSIAEIPGSIQIYTHIDGKVTVIQRIEAWEAERILGTRYGLNGNDDTYLKYRV